MWQKHIHLKNEKLNRRPCKWALELVMAGLGAGWSTVYEAASHHDEHQAYGLSRQQENSLNAEKPPTMTNVFMPISLIFMTVAGVNYIAKNKKAAIVAASLTLGFSAASIHKTYQDAQNREALTKPRTEIIHDNASRLPPNTLKLWEQTKRAAQPDTAFPEAPQAFKLY